MARTDRHHRDSRPARWGIQPVSGRDQGGVRRLRHTEQAGHPAHPVRRHPGYRGQGLRHVEPDRRDQQGRHADRGGHAGGALWPPHRFRSRPDHARDPRGADAAVHDGFWLHPRGAHPPFDGFPARYRYRSRPPRRDVLDRLAGDAARHPRSADRRSGHRQDRPQAAPDRTIHAGADRIDGRPDLRKSLAARASPRPT